jgi:hypothetical protein
VVQKRGLASPVELLPLLRIRRAGPRTAAAPQGAGFSALVKGAIGALRSMAPTSGAAVAGLFGKLLADRHVTFFALRQLRDRADPTRAVFQELTRGRMRLGKVEMQALPDAHTVEIMPHDSHPIARLLGLASGILTPVAQVKIHIDEATLDSES